MTVNLYSVAERLKQAPWSYPQYDHVYSRASLMTWYLRRSLQWASQLECEENWPFFDIAACIDPNLELDEDLVHDVVASLPPTLPQLALIIRTIRWILKFETLLGGGLADLTSLSHPFEPLILMYERGGAFSRDGAGFVEVDGVSIAVHYEGRSRFRAPKPILAFDSETLDGLDRSETFG